MVLLQVPARSTQHTQSEGMRVNSHTTMLLFSWQHAAEHIWKLVELLQAHHIMAGADNIAFKAQVGPVHYTLLFSCKQ
jgi:hypothetical protein